MAASLCLQLYDQINVLIVQVLVNGKISQAAILAAAAYRNHETFKRQTGITNCRLIYDREHHDTKVPSPPSRPPPPPRPLLFVSTLADSQAFTTPMFFCDSLLIHVPLCCSATPLHCSTILSQLAFPFTATCIASLLAFHLDIPYH